MKLKANVVKWLFLLALGGLITALIVGGKPTQKMQPTMGTNQVIRLDVGDNKNLRYIVKYTPVSGNPVVNKLNAGFGIVTKEIPLTGQPINADTGDAVTGDLVLTIYDDFFLSGILNWHSYAQLEIAQAGSGASSSIPLFPANNFTEVQCVAINNLNNVVCGIKHQH